MRPVRLDWLPRGAQLMNWSQRRSARPPFLCQPPPRSLSAAFCRLSRGAAFKPHWRCATRAAPRAFYLNRERQIAQLAPSPRRSRAAGGVAVARARRRSINAGKSVRARKVTSAHLCRCRRANTKPRRRRSLESPLSLVAPNSRRCICAPPSRNDRVCRRPATRQTKPAAAR